MSYSETFVRFARSEAVGAAPHVADEGLQRESLAVAAAYSASLDGLRSERGDTLRLECGFLQDFRFNGVSGVENGRHCCALDANLLGAMLDLAMTALSVGDVLPDVGDADSEDTERVRERNWPMGYALANAAGLDDRRPIDRLTLPKDIDRRRCGVYLQQVALDLLWRHEIAHALLGHVAFVNERLALRVLNERPRGGRSFDVLPLEVEADKHALLSCLDSASQDAAPFQPEGLALSAEERRRCTVLAANLVLWFWAYLEGADRASDPDVETAETHPPPGLRILQLLSGLAEYFVRVTRDADGLAHVVHGVHDDLRAIARAHPRFAILDPLTLYAPERTDAAAAAHRIVAERRDAQIDVLAPFRYFERSR